MGEFLTDAAPAALARAARANLVGLNRYLRLAIGSDWIESPGFFRWRTRVPHPYFNGVVCSAPPDAGAGPRVAASIEHFRAHGLPSFSWWFSPEVAFEAWSPLLEQHGLTLDDSIPGLGIELASLAKPPATAAVVRRVTDRRTREEWTRAFVAGFGHRPEWAEGFAGMYGSLDIVGLRLRSYVAILDGEPVASSTMFFDAGVAGIYDVATVPAARGRGLGALITVVPLIEARAEGYAIGVLHASPMGLPLYERLGFRTVCRVEHFVWKAEAGK